MTTPAPATRRPHPGDCRATPRRASRRHALRLLALLAAAGGAVGCGSCSRLEPATEPRDVVCGGDEVVVEVPTSDGLTLRADLVPATEAGAAAVVLLHMKPPTYDRSGYPADVRRALADAGATVLNLDRRGAGESQGVAEDAYVGDGALLDAEAAVSFLGDGALGCPVDTSLLMLVGASNGTTAVMDYTVGHAADLPHPTALVWMSPGEYTENQNTVAAHRGTLEALPLLWLVPTTEPWSESFVDGAPGSWRFVQRGEEHGTDMFDGGDLQEQTLGEIEGWLTGHVLEPTARRATP